MASLVHYKERNGLRGWTLVSFKGARPALAYTADTLPAGVCAYLDDIKAGCSSTAHIDGDRLHQGTLGKVLNLLRHGGTEEQSLPLALRKARTRLRQWFST